VQEDEFTVNVLLLTHCHRQVNTSTRRVQLTLSAIVFAILLERDDGQQSRELEFLENLGTLRVFVGTMGGVE